MCRKDYLVVRSVAKTDASSLDNGQSRISINLQFKIYDQKSFTVLNTEGSLNVLTFTFPSSFVKKVIRLRSDEKVLPSLAAQFQIKWTLLPQNDVIARQWHQSRAWPYVFRRGQIKSTPFIHVCSSYLFKLVVANSENYLRAYIYADVKITACTKKSF